MVEASIMDFLFGGPVERVALDEKPRRPNTIRGVRANAGIAAEYRRRLEALIDEMNTSIHHWVAAAYRRAPPEMAMDELSSSAMRAAMRKLASRWLKRFDEAAEKLADYFATAVSKRTDAVLKKILKDGGFTIDWTMTRAQRDVVNAVVHENVALIKSIPRDYLMKVETAVMRSVATGRDLHQLSVDLQSQFGVTRKRAAFISLDQNNKASAMLSRARYVEIGIEQAIWCHSHGGRVPRPSHVKAGRDRVVYDVKEGWLDPAINKRIWPGTEPRCRCFSRPVLPR